MKTGLKSAAAGLLLCCAAPLLAAEPAAAGQEYTATEAANIEVVRAFYQALLNDKDADKAVSYLGDVYIQHNPAAQDGAEGLVGFVEFLRNTFPENTSEIKRVFADGDHVILHVHTRRTPEQRGNAVMEIFRLENGKIVEHWDVMQEIPENPANQNTMF